MGDLSSDLADRFLPEGSKKEDIDLKSYLNAVKGVFGVEVSLEEAQVKPVEDIVSWTSQKTKQTYELQKASIGNFFEKLLQFILLQTIDENWKQHLENIDQLKEGINLRAYAQKDPIIEYKKEAFSMFEQVNLSIASQTIEKFFKLKWAGENESQMQHSSSDDLQYSNPDEALEAFSSQPKEADSLSYSHGGEGEEHSLNRRQRRLQKKQKKRFKI